MRLSLPQRLDRSGLEGLCASIERASGPILLVGSCLGMDLSADLQDDRAWSAIRELFARLHEAPPTAAFATGDIRGGGMGLVCACDHVLATRDATFGLPELLLGLVPGAILPALRARIGAARVRQLAIRATAIDAEEAVRIGLVDEIVENERGAMRHLGRLDASSVAALRALLQPDYLAEIDRGIAASRARVPHARPRIERWENGEAPWSA